MRIAVIGQSLFGQEVYKELRKDGHTIVGVFTIPDKDGKADPLGEDSYRGTLKEHGLKEAVSPDKQWRNSSGSRVKKRQ